MVFKTEETPTKSWKDSSFRYTPSSVEVISHQRESIPGTAAGIFFSWLAGTWQPYKCFPFQSQALIESVQSLWWRRALPLTPGGPHPAILTAVEEGTQAPTRLSCQGSDGSPFAEDQTLILIPGSLPSLLSLFQHILLNNCLYFSATL